MVLFAPIVVVTVTWVLIVVVVIMVFVYFMPTNRRRYFFSSFSSSLPIVYHYRSFPFLFTSDIILPTNQHDQIMASSASDNFVEKMKMAKKSMLIFYGSQTGTAEGFAYRLAKDAIRYGLNALVMDPEGCAYDRLSEMRSIENALIVFCTATYGEGDPTDNAQELLEWLTHAPEAGFDLSGINFAVFGLGNKTYENFNAAGKLVDQQMAALKANRICELGLGDDDANIEDDFVIWSELFWTAVCYKFNISPDVVRRSKEENKPSRQYRLIEDVKPAVFFNGEPFGLGSFSAQKPPYGPKNPYLAAIIGKKELHKKGDRSCLHLEFSLGDSGILYEAGDHVAIFPANEAGLVATLAKRLGADLGKVFSLENLDPDAAKKTPFPCPTTYGVALSHYLDITSPLRTNVLRELAEYTDDSKEKELLRLLSSASDEGRAKYAEWVFSSHRDLLAVLEELPHLKPPIDLICELLPRLQPRYYSIASSPKLHPAAVHITAAIVEYRTKTGRKTNGVCTNFLRRKELGAKVQIFIRRSQFRLPYRPSAPVVMVGPGTGVAPFRGFIQDRWFDRKNGKSVSETILYFGCRRRNEDYLYEEELSIWRSEGTLTQLHVAFSREKVTKVYVQHLLRRHGADIWRLINQQQAHIYVCGDASQMAPDVYATLLDICCEEGQLSPADALNYMKQMSKQGRYSVDVWS